MQVKVPYVNHIPTLTGGVGFDELARFYKVCDEVEESNTFISLTSTSTISLARRCLSSLLLLESLHNIASGNAAGHRDHTGLSHKSASSLKSASLL